MLPAERYELTAALMASRFIEIHAGFWFRQIILEAATEEDKRHTEETQIFRIIRNFDNKGGALATITCEDTLRVVAHPLAPLFLPKTPKLRLRDSEQQFLRVACDGLTDEELSRALHMSVSSVKKRWLGLFQRIADAHPAFFADDTGGHHQTRGRQKRHVILAYVRSHPEELAPYEW
jgi:hypothetical protein